MKAGIFTDSHYCEAEVLSETRRPFLSLIKIREAMDAFKAADVDICLCLGDLTDHAPGNTKEDITRYFCESLDLIKSYGMPFYLVPGNHDYAILKREDLSELGIKTPPYTVSFGGYELIILDANYRSDGRCFDVAGVEWTDSNLPKDQVAFLKDALDKADKKCIVCIHENLDPYVDVDHIVINAEEIRKIIRESGKVECVLQGHYHFGAEHTVDGIPYITFPAMGEGTENTFRIMNFE